MVGTLQQVQLSKETALQEEVKRLREERDELREELNCARNDAEQAGRKYEDATANSGRVEGKATALQAEVSFLQDETADLQISHSTLQASAAAQVASAIQKLQEKYELLMEDFKSISGEKLTVSKANRELTGQLAGAQKVISEQEKTIAQISQELAQTRGFVDNVHTRLTTTAVPAKRALEDECAHLESKVQEMESQNAALTQNLEFVQQEYDAFKCSSAEELKCVKADFESQIAALNDQIGSTQKQLAKALTSASADSTELAATKKLNDFIKKQFAEFKDQAAAEYDALREEADGLTAARDSANQRVSELEERCTDLQKDEQELRHCLDTALEASVGVRSNSAGVSANDSHFVHHGAFEGLFRRIGSITDSKFPLGRETAHYA